MFPEGETFIIPLFSYLQEMIARQTWNPIVFWLRRQGSGLIILNIFKQNIKIMKKYLWLFVMAFVMTFAVNAQELANFMQTRTNSPEINASKDSVTFRIPGNYATVVRLSGSWLRGTKNPEPEMHKGEGGIWSITIPLPEPEIYTYNFVVDGVSVNDAANIFVQRDGTRYLSVLLVPGERTANYSAASRCGNLERVWYDSPTIGMNRCMMVYTPYGYRDKVNSRKTYPVLYLLHGGGGDEEAWVSMGRACEILDNLIEKGLAQPMLCVMPNGNAGQQAARIHQIPEKAFDRNDPSRINLYIHSLAKDIIPYIERNYRVIAKKSGRAVAGLSMGGGHTTAVTGNYPELFDYICPLSSGMRESDEAKAQLQAIKKAGYKLYWIGVGDQDTNAYKNSKVLAGMLDSLDMNYTLYVSGGGHEWRNWRLYLNTFAQLLFK
jgi:enterochelin esterase family protein